MRTDEPLPEVGDILAALATGLWHWDTATGEVAVDAEAARLLGLPAREANLTEAQVRSRLHPVDWNEIAGVVRLAAAEGTLAEVRIRVMDERGHIVRVVRSRSKPSFDPVHKTYELVGTLQEVTDPSPGTPAGRSTVTGDWRRSREAFLLDAGRALAEARSTEEVMRVAAGLSMPGFSPDALAVFGVSGDRLTVVGHRGQPQNEANPFVDMPLDADYPAAEVIRTGRAVYLSSPEEYRSRFPTTWPLAERFHRRSWAFLPLIAGGRTMGTWLAAFTHPVAFTPDERSVLTTVARMLAQALSRAGAAETQRELTDGLQRSMLPVLGPEIPGMGIAARYVPTGGGLQVGGDWYDMIPLPGGRFALVIGDVQGHDVRAAGLMGQLRIALRAYAAEGHRPDAVLARASHFFHSLSQSDDDPGDLRFATCYYAEVDPTTGTVESARAGHLDPVVRMADGTALILATAGGLPLGIDPDTDYPTTRFALERGDTLMLCTDGLVETGGHDLQTGWHRLRVVLEEHAGGLEELADALVQAVHGPSSHYTVGPLADRREDDIALLLLCRQSEECGCGESTVAQPPVRRTMLTVAQCEPARIAAARRHLRDLLHDWPSEEQQDAAVLLLSEMLTNVLVHTDTDALLVAEVSGEPGERRIRVEVTDNGDDLPHRRRPGEMASSGRGLMLIELLADAWGVAPRGEGKSIWYELYEYPDPGDGPADGGRPGGPVDGSPAA
ncbi:SpoIIE family protein phosphatase [Streptomyces lancefieldiae]|uniref:SpoIIE family protein phosphatase n=1 Tax=Streptomyces lancefieldiae TaxID=3075520 RepID=A0ABU3AHD9_9ACTN|nr:SpoIIE family protein phosphatase [Streptomyces sp. DSM 40712]MDT0609608.1 SpoIIE family protein phosphatase [Streptomyces sp. DSM 40712]